MFFKMPRGHTLQSARIVRLILVQGGSASFGKAALERARGWAYVADRERSALSLLRDLARYFAPALRRAWA